MSIKYNQFGEVVSVNGIVTGQYLGKPMQDAVAEKPEDNQAYATQRNTVSNAENVVEYNPPVNLPVMVVHLLKVQGENTFTSDKTVAEIVAQLNAGGEVVCWYKGSATGSPCRVSLRFYSDYVVHFTHFNLYGDLATGVIDEASIITLSMASNGTNYYAEGFINMKTT